MATGFDRRGEISIGELVEAMHALRPRPGAAASIAASLGLGWMAAATAAQIDAPVADVPRSDVQTPVEPLASAAPLKPAPIELVPVRQATRSVDLSVAAPSAGASGSLAPADVRAASTRPPYQPLFRDLLWRALVRALFATSTVTSAVDLRLIIKHASSGRPLNRLPWRLKATLRRGVVLILDHSDSMQPFWRDERELVERCGRIIGASGVRAYWVETDLWSDTDARLRWLQRAPDFLAARTPVVIVSDFELGKEIVPRWPLLAPWLPVIEKARSAGAPCSRSCRSPGNCGRLR